jgi:hypothetical protein
MRVAFAVAASNYRHPGINRRISVTAEVFRSNNHEFDIFPLSSNFFGKDIGWVARDYQFKASDYDVVILRSILLARNIKRRMNESQTFVERHHVMRHSESLKDTFRVNWERQILNPVYESKGIFYVTSEIARIDNLKKPSLVVGNPGLDQLLLNVQRRPEAHRVGMSVGDLSAWSGIDIFISLARLKPIFTFVLAIPSEIRIPKRLFMQLPKNVQVVRTKSYSHYVDELASWSHAVGPLALERKGLTEAAPLKVRDYINLGIPTFIRYLDTNLSTCEDPALMQVGFEEPHWQDLFLNWLTNSRDVGINPLTKECIDPVRIEGFKIDFITKTINNTES